MADSNRSYLLSLLLLIVFVVSLSLVLINTGAPLINSMAWDVTIQLDGAWRVVNGQIPYIDFTPNIPSLTILLTALGMKVALPSASSVSSIAYGNVILFLVLTPWSWAIARGRLSAANAFLFAMFMGVLLVAPRPLGDDSHVLSYAMLYNRQGWVILSMLCVELFILCNKVTKSQERWSGLSVSVLLTLLLLCKPTFLLVGVAAVLMRCFFVHISINWASTLASCFLLLVTAMQAFRLLNLPSYISDISLVSNVYRPRLFDRLQSITIDNWQSIFIVVISFVILISEFETITQKNSKLAMLRLAAIGASVIGASILLCSTAMQKNDIPFFFVAGLVYLEYISSKNQYSDRPIGRQQKISYLYIYLLIIPFLMGTILIKDIQNIAFAAKTHHSSQFIEKAEQFKSKALSDFIIPEYMPISNYSGEHNNDYPRQINDGLTLLRKHISGTSRIFTLSYCNLFPLALKLPPPSGGVLNFAPGLNFSEKYFPDAEKVFKGTNMVMIPKSSYDARFSATSVSTSMMKNLYNDYLSKNFLEKDNSEFWALLSHSSL